ncbi:MAG: DUF1028 domain-containing protein [Gemmatimonadota bacterium]|jgi:uncharacterized Ntn-hydrolase superfamily protein|nr:Zn-dependent protease [Dehalococcoidia bacterium]MDP7031935.1 DUF1028 domain-containing protein [Gemmatimonadota bacterium]
MRRFALLFLLVLPTTLVALEPSTTRPVSTYSIVARDAATGEMGVAVQSHWFSVGSLVTWARAGVGAVATQSLVDPTYGPLGLELMQAGRSAPDALAGLLEADSSPQIRQVAMVDANGQVAAHTGAGCIAAAGHVTGEGFTVQANLMDKDTVPRAMADAFTAAQGTLAARMIHALAAAEAEGGDIRGRQSAAILVVKGESSGRPWEDIVVELRVEDHPHPVQELHRLYVLHTGYASMNDGDLALEVGDTAGAEKHYGAAMEILGDNLEARFWAAVALVNSGDVERALPHFLHIFQRGDNWKRLVPRLVDAGLLNADEVVLQRILGEGE